MAVSPYTSQFQNARADLENRIQDGRIKDRRDLEEFLRSRQLTIEEFKEAEEEYEAALESGEASNLPGTVASRLAGTFVGSTGKFAEAIGDVIAQAIKPTRGRINSLGSDTGEDVVRSSGVEYVSLLKIDYQKELDKNYLILQVVVS